MRRIIIISIFFLMPLAAQQFECPKCVPPRVRYAEPPDAYEVEIRGVEEREILAEMITVSRLISEIKKEPSSFPALQYRAKSDIDRMLKVLHAYGHYGAKINVRFEREGEIPKVIVAVYEGPPYPLVSFELVPPEEEAETAFPLDMITLSQLGIALDEPAVAQTILDAERHIRTILIDCGYPLVQIEDQEVIVDQAEQTVAVKLTVDSGPCCSFGPLRIKGLCTVKPRFITQCMSWKPGQRYDTDKVECMVDHLRRSGLFQSISIMYAPEADECGRLPMIIDVKESKHKTIQLGASYSVDQGIGPDCAWENRNLWGMGETLGAEVATGYRRREGKIYFIKPHWLRCDQDLFMSVEGARDTLIAYDQWSVAGNLYVKRHINRHLDVAAGGRVEWLDIDETDNDGSFTLFSAPMKVEYTRVDDQMNPGRGFRIDYDLLPTFYRGGTPALSGRNVHYYTKQIGRFYGYHPVDRGKRLILAGKFMIGSIAGPKEITIPTSHRFLLGSVSTLRGYRYETVGPLNFKGDPVGGRSFVVYGIEGRYRFTEKIGASLFFEAGNAYTNSFPRFNGKLLKSVGVGASYYTPLGPLGIDFAIPLDRRSFDHKFEVYVTVGQSF